MVKLNLDHAPKRRDPSRAAASPSGERWGANNYYFERNGRPFFPVSGEFHYSRCAPEFWDEGLAKMKAGGINLVSTYVFWNHHEEVEGHFDWSGRRDLRRFIEACASQGLKAIVRLGPFCHGEVRNGGFPDWLYGQPFELRSNDEGYLALVRRLYGAIGEQLRGLFFGQGGPIVALQLENEHQHAGAPWEVNPERVEWVTAGRDGAAHLVTLKRLARDAGMDAPFWTATAWGGASVPRGEALPLWGGYAYQPWLFYGAVKEHPPTLEYLFRDHHNNLRPRTENFEPSYSPEDYPYSCCEMGGGMQVWYPHRFVVKPQSVEAMAVVKVAGGCNFLGYYMYHGGTNPSGRVTPFLNEHTCPRFSYDFQAPLSEWGQPREHFHRLRLLHWMLETWSEWLAPLPTVLPPGAEGIDPRDNSAVRWSLRTDGHQGLLFVTNFQDHWQRETLDDLAWQLTTPEGVVRFPAEGTVSLAADESCVLPFHLPLGGLHLVSATAQPVTRLEVEGQRWWIFAAPEGMEPVFQLCGEASRPQGGVWRPRLGVPLTLATAAGSETLLVLSKVEALTLQRVEWGGRTWLVKTAALVLANPEGFSLEWTGDGPLELETLPALPAGGWGAEVVTQVPSANGFASYRITPPDRAAAGHEFALERSSDRQATVFLHPQALEGVRELLLRVDYEGDVGRASQGGQLFADHFAHGVPWEIGLVRSGVEGMRPVVIEVLPLAEKGGVLKSITAVPVRQLYFSSR